MASSVACVFPAVEECAWMKSLMASSVACVFPAAEDCAPVEEIAASGQLFLSTIATGADTIVETDILFVDDYYNNAMISCR